MRGQWAGGLAWAGIGNGQWKVDVEGSFQMDTAAGKEAAEGLAESGPKMAPLLEGLAREIEAGKIRTIGELRERMRGGAATQKGAGGGEG